MLLQLAYWAYNSKHLFINHNKYKPIGNNSENKVNTTLLAADLAIINTSIATALPIHFTTNAPTETTQASKIKELELKIQLLEAERDVLLKAMQ